MNAGVHPPVTLLSQPNNTHRNHDMKDRRTELKVKLKSLAAEAAIIRKEERKALCRDEAGKRRFEDGKRRRNYALYERLLNHRRLNLREELRAAHIAYAILRGKPYATAEPYSKTNPDWDRVLGIALSFGPVYDYRGTELYSDFISRRDRYNKVVIEYINSLRKHETVFRPSDPELASS